MPRFAIAFFALIGLTWTASAQNYNFNLHNESDGWVITGFQTNEGGVWSRNWLRSNIAPGRSRGMVWARQTGACVVDIRVTWQDWGSQEYKINWCTENPTNIRMQNEGLTFD